MRTIGPELYREIRRRLDLLAESISRGQVEQWIQGAGELRAACEQGSFRSGMIPQRCAELQRVTAREASFAAELILLAIFQELQELMESRAGATDAFQ